MRLFLLFVLLFIVSCSTVNKKPYYGLDVNIEYILKEYSNRYNCGKYALLNCKIDQLSFSLSNNIVIEIGTKKVIILSYGDMLQYSDIKKGEVIFWKSYTQEEEDIKNNKVISSFLLEVMRYL